MYNQTSVSKNSKVTLTSAGQDMRANDRFDGTDIGDILVYLSDAGASRIFDIADYLNMSDAHVISTVNSLISQGYVEMASETPSAIQPQEEESEF